MRRFLVVLSIMAAGMMFAPAAQASVIFGGVFGQVPINGDNPLHGVRSYMYPGAAWSVPSGKAASEWVGIEGIDGSGNVWFIQGGMVNSNGISNFACGFDSGGTRSFFNFNKYASDGTLLADYCWTGNLIGAAHIYKLQTCHSGSDWCGYVDNTEKIAFCATDHRFCTAPFGMNNDAQIAGEYTCTGSGCLTDPNLDAQATYGGTLVGYGTVFQSVTEQGNDCGCSTWQTYRAADVDNYLESGKWVGDRDINASTPWVIHWP
jgi:hypothetical protein